MRNWRLLIVLVCVLGVTACNSARPYQYQDELEEPKGPGLLSGESGVFGTPPAAASKSGCTGAVSSGGDCSPTE